MFDDPEWIGVDDEYPDEDVLVTITGLDTNGYRFVVIAMMDDNNDFYDPEDGAYFHTPDYWAPIPSTEDL